MLHWLKPIKVFASWDNVSVPVFVSPIALSPSTLSSSPPQVWTSISHAWGQEHLLGPVAAEHPQQALLSDAEWISGSGNAKHQQKTNNMSIVCPGSWTIMAAVHQIKIVEFWSVFKRLCSVFQLNSFHCQVTIEAIIKIKTEVKAHNNMFLKKSHSCLLSWFWWWFLIFVYYSAEATKLIFCLAC